MATNPIVLVTVFGIGNDRIGDTHGCEHLSGIAASEHPVAVGREVEAVAVVGKIG